MKFFEYFPSSEKQFIIEQDQNLEKVKIILEKSKISSKFPNNGFLQLTQRIFDMVTKNARRT